MVANANSRAMDSRRRMGAALVGMLAATAWSVEPAEDPLCKAQPLVCSENVRVAELPDEWILFDNGGDLYLTDPEAENVINLTDSQGGTWERLVGASLDGSRIAYKLRSDIIVRDLAGTDVRTIPWVPGWQRLSPDGATIASDGYQAIRLVSTEGGSEQVFDLGLEILNGPFTWSPDGRQLMFASFRWQGISPAGLKVLDVATGGWLRLPLFGCGGSSRNPAWSPRGDLIAFQGGADEIFLAMPQCNFSWPTGIHGQNVVFSPDGTRLLVRRDHRLWITNLLGSNSRALPDIDFVSDSSELVWIRVPRP